ncbi:sensor histidine kinase [Haloferula chungangensis]|uniref:histidine kinase n=1 Tax=Haloferula chungangensis TaxID=1048331 RepID=A0ABW2L8C7_9BACT
MKPDKTPDFPQREGRVTWRRGGHLKWLLLLTCWCGVAAACDFDGMSLKEVEAQLEEIDEELATLAHPTVRAGVGNIGWGSKPRKQADHLEWLRVDFVEEAEIDRIVLVPVVWRDPDTGLAGDAFPVEFDVVVGNGESESVVSSFGPADELLPRIAPLVLPLAPVSCSWIEIRAKVLSPRALDGAYAFQLAEVMAFSGKRNVALRGRVSASSLFGSRVGGSYSREALVDGATPYVIDSADGAPSQSCVIFYYTGEVPSLVFDLGESHAVDQIHLHAPDFSESVPQVRHADYGLPRSMRVEGASRPDFSDAVELVDFKRNTIYESGPVIVLRFPRSPCRYVRFTVTDGYKAPEAKEQHRCVGFTEIEILAAGENVAEGVLPELRGEMNFTDGDLGNLTDGRNHFGNILPLREWMEQLARRHDLSLLRPAVSRALLDRYRKQSNTLTLVAWLAGVLAAGLVIAVLMGRIARMRQVTRIKKRFVADLHDEVGANLHAIAILSDIVRGRLKSGEDAEDLLDEVRVISQETSEATRHCTSMVEAKGLCEDLEAELRRSAERLLRDFEHVFRVDGGENLKLLAPRRRIDLLLFFKECLTNVIRHSHATRVEIEVMADARQASLHVRDNGEGSDGGISSSLKRRARLLRAKLDVGSEAGGGTSVSLTLKTRRFGFIHG